MKIGLMSSPKVQERLLKAARVGGVSRLQKPVACHLNVSTAPGLGTAQKCLYMASLTQLEPEGHIHFHSKFRSVMGIQIFYIFPLKCQMFHSNFNLNKFSRMGKPTSSSFCSGLCCMALSVGVRVSIGRCRSDGLGLQGEGSEGSADMCPHLTCLQTRDAGGVIHPLPLSRTQGNLVRQQVYLTQRPRAKEQNSRTETMFTACECACWRD